MDYATDRLDRDNDALWRSYCLALQSKSHRELGRLLCALGWNRHALYHFGQAWMLDFQNNVGDYAQMAELAGYVEIGMMALWVYRLQLPLLRQPSAASEEESWPSPYNKQPGWLQQTEPQQGDCGCGLAECGQDPCFLPFENVDLVLRLLEQYLEDTYADMEDSSGRNHPPPPTMPSAHSILNAYARQEPPPPCRIPLALQFWNHHDDYQSLSTVLQLLLVKLLYQSIPILACQAVVQLLWRDTASLPHNYKSHAAYHTLIQAMVLTNRKIKPSRRHAVEYYAVPVWDLMHGLDRRTDYCERASSSLDADNLRNVFSLHRWKEQMQALPCREELVWTIPPTLWTTHDSNNILQVTGDSHVLSLAWHTVYVPTARLVVPRIVTGLKAMHCRAGTRFFSRTHLQLLLQRRCCTSSRTLILSAGEIDCREGFGGPRLAGYQTHGTEDVEACAEAYMDALQQLLNDSNTGLRQILVMPVAPHAEQSTGRAAGQSSRRRTMRAWNDAVQRKASGRVFFLNYVSHLLADNGQDFVLRQDFNADGTHMNAAFLRHFEQSILECGCNLDWL